MPQQLGASELLPEQSLLDKALKKKKIFFLIGIHSMQGTMRHGVTRKEAQKKITGYRKSV